MFKRLISNWKFEFKTYFAGIKAGKELMNDENNTIVIPPEFAITPSTKQNYINGVYNGMKYYEG